MEVLRLGVTATGTEDSQRVNFITFIPVENYWISKSGSGWVFGGIMRLYLKDSLPFVTLPITYKGKSIEIPSVLVDTGSASTIFSSDHLETVQITPSAEDALHTIRGVGGIEVVFLRKVDCITVGERSIEDFEIEVGGMEYGFEINGILGMDYLMEAGAIINLHEMILDFSDRS
jgi:hypothetical protein